MKKVYFQRNNKRPKGTPPTPVRAIGQVLSETSTHYRLLDTENGSKVWKLKEETEPYVMPASEKQEAKPTISVCADCGSTKVYYIEFRTDGGATARTLDAVNDGVEELDNDDLPKYLGGYYCHACSSLCSTKKGE